MFVRALLFRIRLPFANFWLIPLVSLKFQNFSEINAEKAEQALVEEQASLIAAWKSFAAPQTGDITRTSTKSAKVAPLESDDAATGAEITDVEPTNESAAHLTSLKIQVAEIKKALAVVERTLEAMAVPGNMETAAETERKAE